MPNRPSIDRQLEFASASGFRLAELRGVAPLLAQVLPSGALFALRHGPTLLNQFLPGPVENGLFRLLLRQLEPNGRVVAWSHLVGAGVPFVQANATEASWQSEPMQGVSCEARLQLSTTVAAWCWRIRLRNTTSTPFSCDAMHAQDLGLADEAAVRNNEAYTSQYLDLLPLKDEKFGWTLLARQNQAMAQGHRPWLAFACEQGAVEFCTDGTQFFGTDYRLAEIPAAVRVNSLPSKRLQGEFALAGLQSRLITLAPGESSEIVFAARFIEDHPAASSADDLALLHELLEGSSAGFQTANGRDVQLQTPGVEADPKPGQAGMPALLQQSSSLFVTAPWQHGDALTEADWDAWFPGSRRHVERAADGTLLSFFQAADTHVVSREKEAAIARPHGHILRSGDACWFDADHFGLTCYASGIFATQAYLGHPSFARLLSVLRNPLNISRASGQRVFVRLVGDWRQLGVPSAFAMTPGDARWIYKFGGHIIELRASCARSHSAACLEILVRNGEAVEFLISHELILGASEFEHGGVVHFRATEGWAECRPAAASLVGQYQPKVAFAIAASDVAHVSDLGGDELLYKDGQSRGGPYVVLKTSPVGHTRVLMVGVAEGVDRLAATVEAARRNFADQVSPGQPLSAPVKLLRAGDCAVSRVDDILPWFAHNAAIHFSAPHGLEQYGGAAWGVRDVCQGSVEWLLASGELKTVRHLLQVVFEQQYAVDGSWPQWFMFPPYRFIQQAHSHGDVCFWPVKALCDYIEASDDIGFLNSRVGYTNPQRFVPSGPEETLLAHCDRVIAQCESRFVAGTALVNYGDGDWDDTLQPADPAMRTRMISAWTVGLAFHAFRQLAAVCHRAGDSVRAERLESLCARMRGDFTTRLMPGGVVAGFLVTNADGSTRPLLHPDDAVTHIRYRLLPMTRSILAELFTLDEARRHLAIIEKELRYPDGVRLMSEPSTYQGGVERLFKRAETAANVGREIGLQYVHAHLRYAEALAKVGDADALWTALQVVNPIDLAASVPNAAQRQSNVYFSSSDADFADRYEAAKRWSELRTGSVAVRGGWRLYSSGPGLFLHKVRACLLGVREMFGDVVFDPVLPCSLDGLVATVTLCGRPVELRYHVLERNFSPRAVSVNGVPCLTERREQNPYRLGGLVIPRSELAAQLKETGNIIEITL